MSTTEEVIDEVVTATHVPGPQRMTFLPQFFGKFFMQGEQLLFNWADRLSPQYSGGFWNFYTLSNGGFFAAPHMGVEKVEVRQNLNGYEGSMSEQAFGVVVTLFALNHLIMSLYEKQADEDLIDQLSERYHLLHDFIGTLPDASEIYSAID